MMRPFPDLPGISAFPELNLRTYVEKDGKPGVWFFSLDATQPLAVWAARRFFHLPYVRAKMSLTNSGDDHRFDSVRLPESSPVTFHANYRPTSEVYEASSGTLERWLTERYCLYTKSPAGTLYRTEVHHHPWPLQSAEVEIERNDLLTPHGLEVDGLPPILHFARRLDVVAWSPVILI